MEETVDQPYTDSNGYLIVPQVNGTIAVSSPNGSFIGYFQDYDSFQTAMANQPTGNEIGEPYVRDDGYLIVFLQNGLIAVYDPNGAPVGTFADEASLDAAIANEVPEEEIGEPYSYTAADGKSYYMVPTPQGIQVYSPDGAPVGFFPSEESFEAALASQPQGPGEPYTHTYGDKSFYVVPAQNGINVYSSDGAPIGFFPDVAALEAAIDAEGEDDIPGPYVDDNGFMVQTNPDGSIFVTSPEGVSVGTFASYEAFQTYYNEGQATKNPIIGEEAEKVRGLLQSAWDKANEVDTSGQLAEDYAGYQTYQAGASAAGNQPAGPWLSQEMAGAQGSPVAPAYGTPTMTPNLDFSQFSNPTAYQAPIQQYSGPQNPFVSGLLGDDQLNRYQEYMKQRGLV